MFLVKAMEAIRKQAAKLREQVARQQQVGFFLLVIDFCVLRFICLVTEKNLLYGFLIKVESLKWLMVNL